MKTNKLKDAFKNALEGAKAGDTSAQSLVGCYYLNGEGVRRNKREAKYWSEKAAQKGDPEAIFNLALLCEQEGTPKDSRRAVLLYNKAAMLGDLEAQTNLALKLLAGDGVDRDAEAGIFWLKKAAQRGASIPQYNLGVAYLRGDGVRKSEANAKKWLVKAAKNGDADARRLLKSLERKRAS